MTQMIEMYDKQPMTEKLRCRCRGHGAPEIIDPCIRELVDCLNRHGVETIGSCCGHGCSSGEIVLCADAIEPDLHGRPIWHLKLNVKPIVLPYKDETGDWKDEYPTGGRNLGDICRKLLDEEELEEQRLISEMPS